MFYAKLGNNSLMYTSYTVRLFRQQSLGIESLAGQPIASSGGMRAFKN